MIMSVDYLVPYYCEDVVLMVWFRLVCVAS